MERIDIDQLAEPLRDAARNIASTLREAGHEAWIVGGAVRDLAMGLVPGDVDLATEATPDRLEQLFPGSLGVGRAFGTLIVPARTQGGRVDVELTTFRRDGESSDARRPDRVDYGVSLEEDARRRDFTMNALFLDPLSGEVRDPTGGLDDLRRRVLRTVGDPNERFEEDALRLLRLARFAGRYAFTIERKTREAASRHAPLLDHVSRERMASEWRKAASHRGFATVLQVAGEIGLLEIAAPGAGSDLGQRVSLAQALEAGEQKVGSETAFAVLFDPLVRLGDESAIQSAAGALATLRPSRAESAEVIALWSLAGRLGEFERAPRPRAEAIRIARAKFSEPALRYARARNVVLQEPTLAAIERVDTLRLGPQTELRPKPLLSSKDLIAAGIQPGPALGRWIAALEDRQLEGELSDRASALAFVRSALED